MRELSIFSELSVTSSGFGGLESMTQSNYNQLLGQAWKFLVLSQHCCYGLLPPVFGRMRGRPVGSRTLVHRLAEGHWFRLS